MNHAYVKKNSDDAYQLFYDNINVKIEDKYFKAISIEEKTTKFQ